LRLSSSRGRQEQKICSLGQRPPNHLPKINLAQEKNFASQPLFPLKPPCFKGIWGGAGGEKGKNFFGLIARKKFYWFFSQPGNRKG